MCDIPALSRRNLRRRERLHMEPLFSALMTSLAWSEGRQLGSGETQVCFIKRCEMRQPSAVRTKRSS